VLFAVGGVSCVCTGNFSIAAARGKLMAAVDNENALQQQVRCCVSMRVPV
jgi:hypothetical protein